LEPRQCFPSPIGDTGWWPGDGHVIDIASGRNAVLYGSTSGRTSTRRQTNRSWPRSTSSDSARRQRAGRSQSSPARSSCWPWHPPMGRIGASPLRLWRSRPIVGFTLPRQGGRARSRCSSMARTSRQASLSSNLDSGSSLKFGHRGNPTDTPGCDGALAPSETSLRRWLSPNDHWFDRGISDGQPRLQRADGVIVAPGARCATKYLAINR
jgi:hypothetical protein